MSRFDKRARKKANKVAKNAKGATYVISSQSINKSTPEDPSPEEYTTSQNEMGQGQSQPDLHDKFESRSSRSHSYNSTESPSKRESQLLITDFPLSGKTNSNFYAPSLQQVLSRQHASPSPSRNDSESKL